MKYILLSIQPARRNDDCTSKIYKISTEFFAGPLAESVRCKEQEAGFMGMRIHSNIVEV